ncbi:hypothetical protein, partial [Lacisediminimonas sp.]|uniref:hypothetical protein n=1 Tax=Lacisediminimonas sp. TaxID=3060582 RepID=UPI00271CF96D
AKWVFASFSLVTFFLTRQKESYAPAGAHTPLNNNENKKRLTKPKQKSEKQAKIIIQIKRKIKQITQY